MSPPTREHAKALDAIRDLSRGGVAPSYAELGAALGLKSRGNVHALLHRMRERGLVEFEEGRARSIRIIGELEGLQSRSTADLVALRDRITSILVARS